MSQGAPGGHRWRTSVGTASTQGSSLKTKRGLWTALVALLGGIAVWLLFQLFGGGPSKLQIVSVGMTYDNPVFRPTPFLLDSVQAINELAKQDTSHDQFVESNYPPGTKLDGSEVLEILRDLSLNERENLLVYLNFQGGVIERTGDESGVAACFLTLRAGPDSLHHGVDGQRVLVQELLAECGKTSAANVIVLLEAGDCGPNWRTGILNRDFLVQLKKEVEQAVETYPKLRVIGAVSDGETPHASQHLGGDTARSAFSHFAVRGLLGEADGCKFDPTTGKSSFDDRRKSKVRTVSFDELFAYLHGQVESWSKDHRATRQTVWRIPEKGLPLDLAQTRADSRLAHAADAVSEIVKSDEKSKGNKDSNEPESSSKSKKKTKDNEATSSEDSKEAKSAKGTADKNQDEGNESESSASEKEAIADGSETGTSGNNAKSISSEKIAELQSQLTALWTRRDLVRQSGLAVLIAPREWRRLQLELVHSEQCLRAGDTLDRIEKELAKAKGTLAKVEDQIASYESQRRSPASEIVSLAFVGLAESSAVPTKSDAPSRDGNSAPGKSELSAEEQKQFEDLLKLAFPEASGASPPTTAPQPAPAVTPPNNAASPAKEPLKHEELRKLVLKFPHLQSRIWQQAMEPVLKFAQQAKLGDRAVDDLLKCQAAIQLADELTKDLSGRTTVPAELVTALGVIAVAEAASKEAGRWTSDLRRACGYVIDLRVRFEQFVANDAPTSLLLRNGFEEAEDKLVAAERWLQVGQTGLALQSLERAEAALTAVRTDAEVLRRTAQLKANIAAELPDLARWVALRQEASSRDSTKSTRKLLRSFADARRMSEARSAEEINDLRDFVRVQDETWFGLFDVLEDATELFRLSADEFNSLDDKSERVPSVASNASRVKEIAILTAKVEHAWNEWRSLDREVTTLLSSRKPTPEQWTRIHDALLVPWITADQRRQLLSRLDQLDQVDAVGETSEIRTAVTRGEWQAFWAIETLRLAGLDLQTEQALWETFAKALKVSTIDDDFSESFAASAGLGHDISRAFAKVARQADSAILEHSARRDAVDPERIEQLTRGVDPADPAASGSRSEFWFAKQMTLEFDKLIQNRAAQVARTARLGGQEFAAQWASLADRWRKLIHSTSTSVVSEESPFVLETKFDEPLYWTRGDPAEIKFALVVSPRPGTKFRQTLVRVFDAERLKTEPQKLIMSDGHELKESSDSQELTLTFQKPNSVIATESVITIALLDKETQLPWDVRRLALRTPLKDQDWRIEFRAKGEFAERDHPAAKDRNKGSTAADKNRTVLWLPTSSGDDKPISLQPVLIPPLNNNFSEVSVTVFELDEAGIPRKTPSAKQSNIPLNRDGQPIPLKLASAAAPMPPAADATAKPVTPSVGKDVSRGWIFEILPSGEKETIKQQIIPRVRPPQTYFSPTKLQVAFRNGEMKFELQRREANEEVDRALLPETIRVKLELPEALGVLPTDAQLLLNFKNGEKKSLIARLDEQRLAKVSNRDFMLSVNVGGWPRAFPYRVRHDAPAVEFPPNRPTIVAPANGAVIPMGAKLPIRIQIDSDQLNTFGLDEPWTLACELVSTTESDIARRPAPTQIFRSLDEIIRLTNQGESEWLMTAEVRNHLVEFDTEGLKGRFTAQVSATREGQKSVPLGGGDSEKLMIAIADPERLPPTPKLTTSTLSKVLPGSETDWRVPVSALDSQAGISEIAAGFDLDSDGKLGEKEIFEETKLTWDNPLDEAERRVSVIIRAARIKDKPTGKHKLLVIAKNGVGKTCKDPLVVTMEVDQALGWVVVKVANLDQKGNVLYIDGNKQPGTAKKETIVALPVGEHEFQLANEIVDTRRGRLKKVVIKPEHSKENPISVTLDPPG